MKKGAYDLGRKALYYIIALILIAFIFVYVSNALYKDHMKGLIHLSNLEGVGMINKINSCFYYEDKETGRFYTNTVDMEKFKQETLDKCAEKRVVVTLKRGSKKTSLAYKQETIREETNTYGRIVTIIDRGAEEEGLLQIEVEK